MLDDLRRALRMDSPAPRLSESNLRKLSRGLRSSKKSRLSVHSTLETHSAQDGNLGNRSVSLSTLLPSGGAPGSMPRVDKLQSLEAKMASIEASLGWRRRREALLETLPRAARDLVRELDALHQTAKEKDTVIQRLRNQITNLGGTVTGVTDGPPGSISEDERSAIDDRLEKVQAEMDAKKVAVKNLKLTLDKIDITDNIDVRIRAAELEYELEREELNILNLKEESSILTSRLQETVTPPQPQQNGLKLKGKDLYDLITSPGGCPSLSNMCLVATNVAHSPGNPPFHVTSRPPHGCLIDWATDDTRLLKGDRMIEINGHLVTKGDIDEIAKVMSTSSQLSIIVARSAGASESIKKQLDEKAKENRELVARLDKALKERDANMLDVTRLKHRISYLEDQVSELENTLQKAKEEAISSGNPNEVLSPSLPGSTIIQVFQKGEQTLAVAGSDIESQERVQEYPTLPRLKSPTNSSVDSGPTIRHEDRTLSKTGHKTTNNKPPNQSSPNSVDLNDTKNHNRIPRRNDLKSPDSDSKGSSDMSIYSDKQSTYGTTKGIRPKRSIDDANIQESSTYAAVNGNQRTIPKPMQRGSKDSTRDNRILYDSIGKIRAKSMERSPTPKSNGVCADDGIYQELYGVYQRIRKSTNGSECSNYEPIYTQSIKCSRLNGEIYSNGRSQPMSPTPSTGGSVSNDDRRHHSRSPHRFEKPPRRVLSPDASGRREFDQKQTRPRPIPPKKPERLSLQRTTSMLSVDEGRSCSRTSSVTNGNGRTYTNGYHNWNSADSDMFSENGLTDHEEHYQTGREEHQKSQQDYIGSIPEERNASPPPRSLSQKFMKKCGPFINMIENKKLNNSKNDSSIYETVSKSSKNKNLDESRSKSPDASVHLDAQLGLDHHQDLRARPLYEYVSTRASDSETYSHVKYSSVNQRSSERSEFFHAPPTPSTPPRGIGLSMMSSPKKPEEEWC